MEIVECPGCFSDLRIPPRSEIGGLGAALHDMEGFAGVELQCHFCGTMFKLPPEHHEIDRQQELDATIDRLARELLEGR